MCTASSTYYVSLEEKVGCRGNSNLAGTIKAFLTAEEGCGSGNTITWFMSLDGKISNITELESL